MSVNTANKQYSHQDNQQDNNEFSPVILVDGKWVKVADYSKKAANDQFEPFSPKTKLRVDITKGDVASILKGRVVPGQVLKDSSEPLSQGEVRETFTPGERYIYTKSDGEQILTTLKYYKGDKAVFSAINKKGHKFGITLKIATMESRLKTLAECNAEVKQNRHAEEPAETVQREVREEAPQVQEEIQEETKPQEELEVGYNNVFKLFHRYKTLTEVEKKGLEEKKEERLKFLNYHLGLIEEFKDTNHLKKMGVKNNFPTESVLQAWGFREMYVKILQVKDLQLRGNLLDKFMREYEKFFTARKKYIEDIPKEGTVLAPGVDDTIIRNAKEVN